MFDEDELTEEELTKRENERWIYRELVPDLKRRGLLDLESRPLDCAILDAILRDLFSK
ncbi:MAG: hypothetical protein V7645_3058 [Actinomycetota bacterium]|jgi:hypothetical protein